MTIRKGSKLLIFVVTIFAALPPFAIDTYAPAFDNISNYFHISPNQVAISISTYFVGFAIGMLVWGALSDRFGRRKILIIGMFIYLLSSILCSMSESYNILLAMRCVQGLGDSCGAIVSMSIIRDCYKGKKLAITLATMAMVFMIAPIISPMIGSAILYTTGKWQDIFHFLTLYGILLTILAFFIPETLNKNKQAKSIYDNLHFYINHICNYRFIAYCIASGLCFGAMFTFISSSSILIISYLKYGYVIYCILFGFNFIGVIIANYTIKKKISNTNQYKFIFTGYTISIITLLLSLLISKYYFNIFLFVLFNAIASGSFSLTNAVLTSKSLTEVNKGYGSANAISNLIKFSIGGVASFIISKSVGINLITDIPLNQLIIMVISFLIFLPLAQKSTIK